jgi:cholecystokinin A receptor
MVVAYGLISLELYQGIKFDASQKKSAKGNHLLAGRLYQNNTESLLP